MSIVLLYVENFCLCDAVLVVWYRKVIRRVLVPLDNSWEYQLSLAESDIVNGPWQDTFINSRGKCPVRSGASACAEETNSSNDVLVFNGVLKKYYSTSK